MTLKEITATPFALPEDVLAVLEENSRVVGFKKNELIIRAGDVDVPFYFIKSGLARIFYTPLSTPPPPPPPRDSCKPLEQNMLFGEAGNVATSVTSFMLGRPAVLSVAAVIKASAYVIDGAVIKKLYSESHEFCRWLMELSLIQLSYLEIRHTYLAPKDAYQRFLNFIRFKPKSFIRRVPAYQIASYLNITPTALSLIQARYARDNVKVKYDKDFLDGVGITGKAPD